MLGVFLTDINLGIFTAHLDQKHSSYVTSEKTLIQFHSYEEIRLPDFVLGLIQADIHRRELNLPTQVHPPASFSPVPDRPIAIARLFERLNSFIAPDTIVIADAGDVLFAGLELFVHGKTRFLSPAYYASLGFTVPASVAHSLPILMFGHWCWWEMAHFR